LCEYELSEDNCQCWALVLAVLNFWGPVTGVMCSCLSSCALGTGICMGRCQLNNIFLFPKIRIPPAVLKLSSEMVGKETILSDCSKCRKQYSDDG